jgi:hypothetical protein
VPSPPNTPASGTQVLLSALARAAAAHSASVSHCICAALQRATTSYCSCAEAGSTAAVTAPLRSALLALCSCDSSEKYASNTTEWLLAVVEGLVESRLKCTRHHSSLALRVDGVGCTPPYTTSTAATLNGTAVEEVEAEAVDGAAAEAKNGRSAF